MIPADLISLLLFPLALGLLGFIEPCSIGSSLLFLKYVEGREAVERVAHTVLFTLTRATFMGGLGAMAALVGATALGIQKAGWLFLGAVYVAIGVMYVTGTAASLKRRMGPRWGAFGWQVIVPEYRDRVTIEQWPPCPVRSLHAGFCCLDKGG